VAKQLETFEQRSPHVNIPVYGSTMRMQ